MPTPADSVFAATAASFGAAVRFPHTVLALTLAFSGCGNALGQAPEPPSWRFRVEASAGAGAADGFLQTPRGGQPGSSSPQRPSLEELGLEDALLLQGDFVVEHRALRFFAGANLAGLHSDARLERDLISRDVQFSAGTQVAADTRFDWYHAGLGWSFDELWSDGLVVRPKIEFALLNFHYALESTTESVSRKYSKGCLRLGLEAEYQLSRTVRLGLDVSGAVPLDNTPQIARAVVRAEIHPWGSGRRLDPALVVGCGVERIDYEDQQAQPNHIRLDLTPRVTLGVSLAF